MKIATTVLFISILSNAAQSQCVVKANEKLGASRLALAGNYALDLPEDASNTIQHLFAYLNRKYTQSVKYAYVNDYNAYYRDGTDSIFLGIPFFKELWESGGAMSVAIVICHEFSHYGQYLFPNDNRVVGGTHRISELQADFIGAYLMFNMFTEKIIAYSEDGYDETIKNIFELGDNAFNDPYHHGSYIERLLTVMLVEGTELGQDFTLPMSGIYELANKIYTSTGINICDNLPGPLKEITGGGFLYDKSKEKYYVIAIDFKVYPAYVKRSGQSISIKSCVPEGNIDVSKSQHLNMKDQTLGFYINVSNESGCSQLYVFDKDVYTDESKTEIVSNWTWRKDLPFIPISPSK